MAGIERQSGRNNIPVSDETKSVHSNLSSLLQCLRCISRRAMAAKDENIESIHIPYRNSKLCRLLQPILDGGDNVSLTLMMNVHGGSEDYAEKRALLLDIRGLGNVSYVRRRPTFLDVNKEDSEMQLLPQSANGRRHKLSKVNGTPPRAALKGWLKKSPLLSPRGNIRRKALVSQQRNKQINQSLAPGVDENISPNHHDFHHTDLHSLNRMDSYMTLLESHSKLKEEYDILLTSHRNLQKEYASAIQKRKSAMEHSQQSIPPVRRFVKEFSLIPTLLQEHIISCKNLAETNQDNIIRKRGPSFNLKPPEKWDSHNMKVQDIRSFRRKHMNATTWEEKQETKRSSVSQFANNIDKNSIKDNKVHCDRIVESSLIHMNYASNKKEVTSTMCHHKKNSA